MPEPDPAPNPMREVADNAEIFEAKWNAVANLTTILYRLARPDNEGQFDTFRIESHDTPESAVTGPFAELCQHVAAMKTRSLEERRKLPLSLEVRGVKWHHKNGDVLVSLSVNEKTEFGNIHYNTPFASIFAEADPDSGESEKTPLPDGMKTTLDKLLAGLRDYLAGVRMPPPQPEPSLFDGLDDAPANNPAPVGARAGTGDGTLPDGKEQIVLHENPRKRIEAACCHWPDADGAIRTDLIFTAPKHNHSLPESAETFESALAAVEWAQGEALAWLDGFDKAEAKKYEKTLTA